MAGAENREPVVGVMPSTVGICATYSGPVAWCLYGGATPTTTRSTVPPDE